MGCQLFTCHMLCGLGIQWLPLGSSMGLLSQIWWLSMHWGLLLSRPGTSLLYHWLLVHQASQSIPQILTCLLPMGATLSLLAIVYSAAVDQGTWTCIVLQHLWQHPALVCNAKRAISWSETPPYSLQVVDAMLQHVLTVAFWMARSSLPWLLRFSHNAQVYR